MLLSKAWRRLLLLSGIIILIIIANISGSKRQRLSEQISPEQFFEDSDHILKKVNDHKWRTYNSDGLHTGHVYLGNGRGYNGLVHVMVHTGMEGNIVGLKAIKHDETPSYFQKISRSGFFEHFTGLMVKDIQHDSPPIQVVSGATISSRAVIQGISNAYIEGENMDGRGAGMPVFGWPAVMVSVLLMAGYVLRYIRNLRWQKMIRWAIMLLSVVFLGFVFNHFITLSRIAAMLSGYFPDPIHELPVYILIFGSVLLVVISRSNVYCHSVCPFGAAQEALGVVGGARPYRPDWHKKWKILQWSAALIAVLLAIVMNNPSLAQYEVFGAFFQLTASVLLFVVLIFVIAISLFVKRPWCHFFCPVDGFFAFARLLRKP
jgi:NosR/NirI family transcriptional regulator, nitrous oxide reductase regulator